MIKKANIFSFKKIHNWFSGPSFNIFNPIHNLAYDIKTQYSAFENFEIMQKCNEDITDQFAFILCTCCLFLATIVAAWLVLDFNHSLLQ